MFDQLMQGLDVQKIKTDVLAYLPNVVAALVLLIVFWVVTKLIKNGLSRALGRAHVPEDAREVIVRFAGYAVMIVALLTVASQLGIKVTSIIAGLGVVGLAVSFAAQDTVANVISGVTLLIDRPFKKGDWVCIGDTHATVSQVRLRTTVLTTFDNETLVMPNKALAQERIVNFTLVPRIRIRVAIGIAYKEDIATARQTMLGTLEGDDRILAEPAPMVIVTGLGDSSVNLEMRFWTEESLLKFPLQWEYIEKCKKALDAANIEIPFPHQQLFLERSEGLSDLIRSGAAV